MELPEIRADQQSHRSSIRRINVHVAKFLMPIPVKLLYLKCERSTGNWAVALAPASTNNSDD